MTGESFWREGSHFGGKGMRRKSFWREGEGGGSHFGRGGGVVIRATVTTRTDYPGEKIVVWLFTY